MKFKINYTAAALIIVFLYLFSACSKKPGEGAGETSPAIETKIVSENGFNYKVFFQTANRGEPRRGLIILAVGDGGNVDDPVLNSQCEGLAKEGFVAITTTYRANPGTYTNWMVRFKEDMEQIIANETTAYKIDRKKVVIGGLSRGGNLTFGLVLPGQLGAVPPIAGIKGVVLECAGGDNWKGSAILFPVLFMSNATDAAVGTDAEAFKNGMQSNANSGVKSNSKMLIIPGQGHCTKPDQYRAFLVNNIESWF